MKREKTAADYKLLAQLILWGFISLPWIKEYGTGVGAWIGGAIAAAIWYGFAFLSWLCNRHEE
ncbi:hypothetical protein [Caballeronia concitans]|uniref:Uncharacterized protein n=1 Tax=Caballeronia concitans TaxID=1777133 RepID=A0A658R5S1_9BURK|nr:hypothetical protein [Caballeronia concitans]SAL51359.1 hypothetical protein AWB72_05433 [Caballeronia concitans]